MNYNKMGVLLNDVDFSFYFDRYLNHHSSILITKESKLLIRAYTVDIFNRNNNIISTMGEFFEREILINKNQNKSLNLTAFSLLTGETIEISKNEIIYIDRFVDSCGMASHIISHLLIKKAFFEYFERQCLVLSFLSKYSAAKINLSCYKKSETISQYICYLKNYIDDIRFYNISISRYIYVILGIGLGNNTKCIGLGTSENITDALEKAMQEMLQYFFCSYSKRNQNQINSVFYDETNERDLYHTYFDKLSCKDFLNQYSYLDNTNQELGLPKNKEFSFMDFLDEIHHSFGMNPYAVFFPNQRNISNLKVLKIYDNNWFPNILPPTYTKEIYSHVESATDRVLQKNCKMIPFP